MNQHAWYAANMRDRSLAALVARGVAGEKFPPPPRPPGREPPHAAPERDTRIWVPPGARLD